MVVCLFVLFYFVVNRINRRSTDLVHFVHSGTFQKKNSIFQKTFLEKKFEKKNVHLFSLIKLKKFE